MTLRKSKGDMYPQCGWTINFLAGRCPHNCVYCYVSLPPVSFSDKYKGSIRLHEKEFQENLEDLEVERVFNPPGIALDRPIVFVCSCYDLFARDVPRDMILKVLHHLRKYEENVYLLHTKNPRRLLEFHRTQFPKHILFGITMETNREIHYSEVSKAPSPLVRDYDMSKVVRKFYDVPVMISIEPILRHDPEKFLDLNLFDYEVSMVSVGINSKTQEKAQPPKWWKPKPAHIETTIRGLKEKETVNSLLLKKNSKPLIEQKTDLEVEWMERGALVKTPLIRSR